MNKEQGGNETVDLSKCPDVKMLNEYQGKDKEVKVFNNNGEPEAYMFNASKNKWEDVGKVVNPSSSNTSGKKYYHGDDYFHEGEYDYVFDVELEGIKFLIPFNQDGNALVAAENFCNRGNLHRGYIDEIRNFLRQNSQPQKVGKPMPKPEQKKPTNNNTNSSNTGHKQIFVPMFSGSFKFPKVSNKLN